ncbi:Phosphoenolpyruvate transferase [Paraconexibacter sp. AEG42_29]|uniref:Phosphoenolpyruvate transferase n=1 Tax=Paraconexibacter sp. AEG42_29 TaxID=2997339 RepID=A0AAU7ATI0_9ACTN
MTVVVLAGGTGGAKLARGVLDVVGPGELTVIANTGDDIEIHGGYVSPDPDLCTFWLADQINDRGWGIDGDTFAVMDGLRAIGVDVWFNLGDRDLAICIDRARRLAAGERLTTAHAALVEALGVSATVLPMCDGPVRTRVRAAGTWRPFQDFMIRDGAQGPIEEVAFDGIDAARATPEVLDAIAGATAVIVGPSNPIISIGPILAVPGIADALRATSAPVVAVSPIVGGTIVKGPSEAFMESAGLPLTAAGIATAYDGLLDGLVADEEAPGAGLPVIVTDTMMGDPDARARVARSTLTFAEGLAQAR